MHDACMHSNEHISMPPKLAADSNEIPKNVTVFSLSSRREISQPHFWENTNNVTRIIAAVLFSLLNWTLLMLN